MTGEFVGVLPAAGRGTRLAPLRYPKELLPITYEPVGGNGTGVRARAVAEYALGAIAGAEAERVLLVVAPWKLDVLNYFGDGRHVGLEICYLYQEEARGLPYAVDLARSWTRGEHVVFAMPDTIITPVDTGARLRERYLATGADLALAVFPTAEPRRLAPVVLLGGRVIRVLDKPRDPPVSNTWGAAVWGPAFTRLLNERLRETPGAGGAEPVLGEYFDLAIREGLRVTALEFPEGRFDDLGTFLGIHRFLGGGPVPAAHAAA
jgi:glucose-1-phosphate thymidylyltransferase